MARRKFEEDNEHVDRWLVSYADLVTLLFAFFVVMYAISSVNEGKYKVLSNALGQAFGMDRIVQPIANPIRDQSASPTAKPILSKKERVAEQTLRREKDQMTGMARDILKALAPLVSQGKVKVTQSARGLSIEISESVLFAAGEARVNPGAVQALSAVAQVLANDTHAIQVEGHTDDTPINTPYFPSNWELSAVRAGSVIRLFIDKGIAEKRVTAVGRGSTRPIAPNTTPEGRARNRRVEVLILAELPDAVVEVPVAVPAAAR